MAIALTIFLAAVIGVLTLLPLETPEVLPGSDKIHHVLGFAALAFPSAFLFPKLVRWIAPLALAYGALIEVVQPYVGRIGEASDFWADAIGVLIGLGLGLVANAREGRTRRKP
jgi:VanZ family protein